ncbi:MAG: hypothetical protein HZB53_22430 [Chloroflexi bacterium]|nr:hypothetical protein [Chloroflexota bacterium]
MPSATPVPPTATPTGTATATPAPSHSPTIIATGTPTETPAPPTATRLPATPTPQPIADTGQAPPACPGWFGTPEPGKALLTIENYINEPVAVGNIPGRSELQVPAASDAEPGRITLALGPDAYELPINATFGGTSVRVQLGSGQYWLVALTAESVIGAGGRNSPKDKSIVSRVSPLTPPWGCPGGAPPVVVVSPPQCPAWFTTPQEGKGIIVFENHTTNSSIIDGIDGVSFSAPFPKRTGSEPTRLVASFAPGRYRFSLFLHNFTVDLASGQQVAVRWGSPTYPPDVTVLIVPAGCAGYVAPTPAAPPPPPTCPAWFARPEPGKALLVVENHGGKAPVVTLKALAGISLDIQMPPKVGDEPGRHVLMLTPGHYEFEASPYGMIIVDLAAGAMKVAPIHAPRVEQRPVFDLPVPPACN